MLNPDSVVSATIAAIRQISEAASAVGADSDESRITGHYFQAGSEPNLALAVYQMKRPSILVAYDSMLGGNFDGATIFKHRVNVFARVANQAGETTPIGLGHLWWLICNKPVGHGNNIRYAHVLDGMDIMDTPSMVIKTDEEGQDYLHGTMVFPEIGDDL